MPTKLRPLRPNIEHLKHQAALAGHADVVRLLVERGARLDIADIHHQGTPLKWAEYAGRAEVAEYLRGLRDLRG
jgi:ankyrin repeat protein